MPAKPVLSLREAIAAAKKAQQERIRDELMVAGAGPSADSGGSAAIDDSSHDDDQSRRRCDDAQENDTPPTEGRREGARSGVGFGCSQPPAEQNEAPSLETSASLHADEGTTAAACNDRAIRAVDGQPEPPSAAAAVVRCVDRLLDKRLRETDGQTMLDPNFAVEDGRSGGGGGGSGGGCEPAVAKKHRSVADFAAKVRSGSLSFLN